MKESAKIVGKDEETGLPVLANGKVRVKTRRAIKNDNINAGEIAGFSPAVANRMISDGVAFLCDHEGQPLEKRQGGGKKPNKGAPGEQGG